MPVIPPGFLNPPGSTVTPPVGAPGPYRAPDYWAADYWPAGYFASASLAPAYVPPGTDRDVYADILARLKAAFAGAAQVSLANPERTATRGLFVNVIEAAPGQARDDPDGTPARERRSVTYQVVLSLAGLDEVRALAALDAAAETARAALVNKALAGFCIARETRLIRAGADVSDSPFRRRPMVGTFAYTRPVGSANGQANVT